MPVQNQDSFLKIAQTAQHAATEVRYMFYTRLVRQRHYFGNLLSKVQLLKKFETSPEVQRLADMINTVSSTKT